MSLWSGVLLALRERLHGILESGGVGGAVVEENAVAEGEGLAFFEGVVAEVFVLLPFEVVLTEGVCSDEAVVPGVPPGGVAEVGGVVEDGDDGRLAGIVGAGVGDPGGAFAPAVVVGLSVAIQDGAFGCLTFESEGGREAEGEGAFLGVAEDGVGVGGREDGGDVDGAGFAGGGDRVGADLGEVDGVAFLPGEVDGKAGGFGQSSGGSGAGGGWSETLVDNGALTFEMLGPEIDAVDEAVGHPHGDVVRVIGLFVFAGLGEGVVAGEAAAGGADEGVKAGDFVVAAVFGEELAGDLDAKAGILDLEFDLGPEGGGGEEEAEGEEAHG